jgi:uncharacterized Zn-finger protein
MRFHDEIMAVCGGLSTKFSSGVTIMAAMVQDDPKHRLIVPNALHHYSVNTGDLPLSCPMPGMLLWNSHPKVYLAIEASGWAKCSYCGAEYTLNRNAPGHADIASETDS